MLPFLHKLSAILFFLIAGSFFIAYLLAHNEIGLPDSVLWLHVGQLPLASVALLYAATSMIASLSPGKKPGIGLILWISIPAIALFVLFALLKLTILTLA